MHNHCSKFEEKNLVKEKIKHICLQQTHSVPYERKKPPNVSL